MKAIRIHTIGSPEAFVYADVPDQLLLMARMSVVFSQMVMSMDWSVSRALPAVIPIFDYRNTSVVSLKIGTLLL